MPSIITPSVTIPCFRVVGSALPQQQRIKTFGITGVDGVGVHLLGRFGKPVNWIVKQYGSFVGLQAWFDDLSLSVGDVGVFTNDEGEDFPNQLIEAVATPQKKTAHDLDGAVEIWTVSVSSRTV